MTRGFLGLTFLVLACASQVFGFKKDDPEWMTNVTPAGQPRVEVTLAASGRPGLFEKLTLSHQLRFDGVSYQSKLSILELDSRLVPKGEGRYEWRTPTGKVIGIDMTATAKTTHNSWKIIRSVGDGEVAVVGGEIEVYVYRKSRLVEYEKAGARYFLNFKDGVSEVVNKRGVVLIRLIDHGTGSQTLTAFGTSLTLRYGENRELCRCVGDGFTEREFFYNSGLLVGFRLGNDWRRFTWGEAKYKKYERTEKRIPPVVTAHGGYTFEYVTTGQSLAGTAYFNGAEIGTWRFSYKTERYRLTSHEGRLALSTNGPVNDDDNPTQP
jgi:hypothetical protein